MTPSKEQIAHDLAIAYINNRYGVDVIGDFNVSGSVDNIYGSGNVSTEHFPDVNTIKQIKVATGKKGLLGFEKKKWVEDGFTMDEVFISMISDYKAAYIRILEILNKDNA